LWKAGKDAVAVVKTAGDESCNELRHHIIVDVSSDLLQPSELVEAAKSIVLYIADEPNCVATFREDRCRDGGKSMFGKKLDVKYDVRSSVTQRATAIMV